MILFDIKRAERIRKVLVSINNSKRNPQLYEVM
jgi:hypothetical protein